MATTAAELTALVQRLSAQDELLVGQEVGKLCHFVHDTLTAAGVKVLSFNAHQLRMIASSRKKTDHRDAYWIAKALQTGMVPHPVYVPTGEVRTLRALVSRRDALVTEHKRWLSRARSYLQAAGYKTKVCRSVPRLIQSVMAEPEGMDESLAQALDLCSRMGEHAKLELKRLEATRFHRASELASYAGRLVPSVEQSGQSRRNGGITKEGARGLRTMLVQAGHVLLFRCRTEQAAPLKAIAERVHTARARRKIAVVAAARHILRLAYYVLRDGTEYNPKLLRSAPPQLEKPAA